MNARVCLVMHDVAPATWERCEAVMQRLASVCDGPWTFLAVPNYHRRGRLDRDDHFRRGLNRYLEKGCEIAQHGYFHLDPRAARGIGQHVRRRMYTAGEGEFSALDYAAARRRIEAGRAVLARAGWRADGFVAPAWLCSAEAQRAVEEAGFAYCSSLGDITALPEGRPVAGRSFCYSARSLLRRKISRVFNSQLLRRLSNEPVVRVAMHPADAEHEELLKHAQWLVAELVKRREPVVKRSLLAT